jgi:two-component system cell cycle response regulator
MCARVLVVDDDPVNADLIGYLLRAFGHEAILALGGQEALREAAAQVPDLVLCDIQMPGVDGFEVLRRLRSDKRFDRTEIVGVTALAMVGDREKVLAAGFDGYLTKPITPETFVPEVEKHLPAQCRTGFSPSMPSQGDGLKSVLHQGTTPQKPKRIGYALVVDDVEPNVQLMRHLLTSLGVEVRAARSAADALLVARAVPPTLIICDIHMPGMSGIDLLETAKSDAMLKDVPFLLISASQPNVDEERRAVAAGADLVLRRPIDPEALLEHLSEWIPGELEP